MGFILDGLDTESYDREYSDRELLGRTLKFFKPHRRKVGLVALMLTLNSIAGSGGPIMIANAIDLVSASPTLERMLLVTGMVLLFGASAWVTNFLRQRTSARVVGDVVLGLRGDVLEATIHHDMSFYDEHPSGKIVSRITSDTQDFSDVVTLIINLLSQVMTIAILIVWLLNVNVILTIILLAMSPLAIIVALSFRRVARRVTQNARRVTAKINAQIQESISGIMVAKSFRKERSIYNTFAQNNSQAYDVGIRRGITLNTIFPIMGMSSGVGTALLVFTAGLRVQTGAITPGEWYLFMQAVGYFWFPLMGIASFWSQFQDGLAAAERVYALIDAIPDVVQKESVSVPAIEGKIEFKDLTFSYTENEIVLPNFNLMIASGETVALVGHTGAGKSSIAKLISRFYEFQSGELNIDGKDIRSFDLDAYRKQIGLVPQDPFLFSGTVADNIHYSRPEADESEVCHAAEQISGGDWIADLPKGLDTDVGERGSNLSMGQRQLVALARVLLKNPAVLILDEATASVDPFTETQIQEGLQRVLQGRTAVIIAHRLWTIQNADRIIVLQAGKTIAEGTHDSLMAQGGHYAELYDTYFRHQSLEYIEGKTEGK
jgi:ABC-type multidrug transport system fused ATPase/permease subunit